MRLRCLFAKSLSIGAQMMGLFACSGSPVVELPQLTFSQPLLANCDSAQADLAYDSPDESDLPELNVEAGFVDLPAVSYRVFSPASKQWLDLTSTRARLFFSFVPADSSAKSAPLFLFFNGGPGASTMMGLRAQGTAPRTINLDTGEPEDNPHSWAALGNLLYVDARGTGFSHSADPMSCTQFPCPADYNPYMDAADFIRVLLAIYAKYPALEDNPVVIVGESYGGKRAQILLHTLRTQPFLHGSGGLLEDPRLAQDLADHEARVNARRRASGLSQWNLQDQYAWQVLVQPSLISAWQVPYGRLRDAQEVTAGIERRAHALGVDLASKSCPDGGPYDDYRFDRCSSVSEEEDCRNLTSLLTPTTFADIMGVAPSDVRGLPAAERMDASRVTNIVSPSESCRLPPDAWVDSLGRISTGVNDEYFVPFLALRREWESLSLFDNYLDGRLFLENLRGVSTFVTRALLDTVVLADLLPVALESFVPGTANANALATSKGAAAIVEVTTDIGAVTELARPGHIDVTYRNGTNAHAPFARRIRFPTYENCGHMTARDCPRELYEDVRGFLCAPSAP